MVYKDYYKILGLETSHVSINEIKTAYRNAAKKYHPDLNVGNNTSEERIKDINEAYRILSVPASKRKYDRTWNAHHTKLQQKGLRNKESIFEMFLGNIDKSSGTNADSPVCGEDVETEIEVPIEEAYFGTEKTVSLKAVDGKNKTFTINIPKGIQNGGKIRLLGQGKDGKNGGKNGNLYIKIKIQDNKTFKLAGYDLCTDLLLTPWEAGLGARVTIPTMEDETKIYIPQGIQSGEKLRIPNKGYYTAQGGRGDLIAEIKIVVPRKMDDQEKAIYEQLKEISKFNPRENAVK